MFSTTSLALRKRNPWRELLHPLPIRARQYLWWKRDATELTEEILRRPFYKLKKKDVAAATASVSTSSVKNNNSTVGPLLEEDDIIPRDVRLLKPNHPESFAVLPVKKTGERF